MLEGDMTCHNKRECWGTLIFFKVPINRLHFPSSSSTGSKYDRWSIDGALIQPCVNEYTSDSVFRAKRQKY